MHESTSRRLLLWIAVAAFFVTATVIHTWPLVPMAGSHRQGGPDPATMMWPLVDLARNLVSNPLHLFEGTAFYPYDRTAAVVDHQFGNALVVAPLAAMGADALLLYNVAVLATFVLTGLFTCVLVRRLTGSLPAALVAGCAFAFSAARVYTLPHPHVLAAQWLPLALLALHRFNERPTLRRWTAFAVGALLVALSSWHLAIIGGIAIGVVASIGLLVDSREARRRVLGLLGAAVICASALAPIARVYAEVGSRWPPGGGEGPTVAVAERNSVDVTEVVFMPADSQSPLAGLLARSGPSLFPGLATLMLAATALPILRRSRRAERGSGRRIGRWLTVFACAPAATIALAAAVAGAESAVVAGLRPFAPFVLASVALLAASVTGARRRRVAAGENTGPPQLAVAYAIVALVGLLLALGPQVTVTEIDVGSGIWRLDLLPLPLLLRAPVRFGMLVALGLSVLAGLGTARLLRSRTSRNSWVLAALVLLFLNVDLAFSLPELSQAPEPTAVDRWLAESEEEGAVLEFPFPVDGNYWAIYRSQQLYGRRNVDGHGYMRPPEMRRIRLLDDLSRVQVDLLWQYSRPRFLVVRGGLYPPAERERVRAAIDALGPALRLRIQDGDDAVYELFDRGGGALLERYWPANALYRSSGTLRIEGGLSGGRADTVGELHVDLNGHTLLQASQRELRSFLNVEFGPEHIVQGLNRFEIRAGYRFRPRAEGHPIGEAGMVLRADVEVGASEDLAEIVSNGWVHRSRGGSLAASIDPQTGAILNLTEVPADAPVADPGWLTSFLRGLPPRGVVAVALAPGQLARLESDAVEALRSVGIVVPGESVDAALAAVGVVGASEGSTPSLVSPEARVVVGEPDGRRFRLRGLDLR